MKILTNREAISGGVLEALAGRSGIVKAASAAKPCRSERHDQIHANKVAASFARSSFMASSPPPVSDALEKEAEVNVGKKATAFLKTALKQQKITAVALNVKAVANAQYKTAGITKKRPVAAYADVIVDIKHPSFLGDKVASCVVTVADGKVIEPAAFVYDDAYYDFSKAGWDRLLSHSIPRYKTASADVKHVVLRKYSQTNEDGTITEVPSGYYESIGSTADYVPLSKELKQCGIIIAQRSNLPGIGNAIEPLLLTKNDEARVTGIVDKYCQTAPVDTADKAVTTKIVNDSEAPRLLDRLKATAKPGTTITTENTPGGNTSITTGNKKGTDTTATGSTKIAQIDGHVGLDTLDPLYEDSDKDDSGLDKEWLQYTIDQLTSMLASASLDPKDRPALEEALNNLKSLDSLEEPTPTSSMQGTGETDSAAPLGFNAAKKTAARTAGTAWSEGSNDAPTKNKGPASGGKLEAKRPDGVTQKLSPSGKSRKAPAGEDREQSVAWSNGGGAEATPMQSIGKNEPPTVNEGPASGGVKEVRGPGGTQKLWNQQNKTPGSTSKPKDGGTVEEFFGRELAATEADGKVDAWFTREGGKAESNDNFFTREQPKGGGAKKDFWGETPKAKSTGSMSPLMKGSSIQKYACGPHQTALRARLLRSRGVPEDVIEKEAGMWGTALPIAGSFLGPVGGFAGGVIGSRMDGKGWGESLANGAISVIPGGMAAKGIRAGVGKGLASAVGKGLITNPQAAMVTSTLGKGVAGLARNKRLLASLGGAAAISGGGGANGATPGMLPGATTGGPGMMPGTMPGMLPGATTGVGAGNAMPMMQGGISPEQLAMLQQLYESGALQQLLAGAGAG